MANHLEPFSYLCRLFEKLLFASTEEDHRQLMPQHIDKSGITADTREK